MSALTDWRRALTDRVATATGLAGFDHPPPSITPPCVVCLVGADYVTGPRRTGCVVDTRVTIRLVSEVLESAGVYDDLDDLIVAALAMLPDFQTVNVAARQYGESRWMVADIVVDDVATVPYPAPTNGAVQREGAHA